MNEGSLGRRYARALLELAQEQQQVDQIGNELQAFQAALDSAGMEATAILANPTFTLPERKAVLEQVLGGLALSTTTRNFLRLLLDKGRFAALGSVLREYQALSDEVAGRVRAQLYTSGPMSAGMAATVREALVQATGKQVILETREDPTLLGGMVARIGSRVFDASLATRFDNIQRALLDGAQV